MLTRCLLFAAFLVSAPALATRVSGTVTDLRGEPLAFVNIHVAGTHRSTTANENGKFSLELEPGNYDIVFRMVGYKTLTLPVVVSGEKQEVPVMMEAEVYNLAEVKINAGEEDPAYAVIRGAITKRKYHLEQVESFTCDVYIKGLQRVTKFPKKIMGMQVDPRGNIDTVSGIVYLSESVSKYWFKQKDKIREEMISSRISGNNRAFSYNRASDMMFNFYENLIEVEDLSKRGFVSPINANAFFFYRYRLHGSFMENGEMVNKIEVIPKRDNDPCFRGFIYIIENSWKIHSTDLYLTKNAQISFVDTLRVKQVYFPVKPDVWMVLSNRFEFSFSFFGIQGNGVFMGVHSNYVIDPVLPQNFFTGEEWKVEEDANKKDSSYWNSVRPVPLTTEEKTDYRKKDSTEKIRTSEPYLDSVDRVTNKPTAGKIFLTGMTINRRYKKREWEVSPLIANIAFNTVQGPVAGIHLGFSQRMENNKRVAARAHVSYGFSDERINATFSLQYSYNPKHFSRWKIAGGQHTPQLNETNPVGPLLNSLYSLLDERNYARFFSKSFILIEHDMEIINGLYFRVGGEYAWKQPLYNTSFYHWINYEEREYAGNNPLNPSSELTAVFPSHRAFYADVNVRLRFGQKYITRPGRKIVTGSKWPAFVIAYRKAVAGIGGSEPDFDLLKISIHDEIKLKLLGSLTYMITAGTFLSGRTIYFTDRQHFAGNQTLYSTFALTRYNLLDYYSYSTLSEFLEVHAEHRFGGFIVNKLPLMRRLKLSDIAGVHFLSTKQLPNYLEAFFGLEKLGVVRADFVMGFEPDRKPVTGFRFGIFVD
ncbi:MAG: carboxypeptidase-like regulatory domain-containing protein [Bacteroidia bacterium]|nr:carboxypeptidase-like regulatory domain-containing protein [Bacteroidia bacterium]